MAKRPALLLVIRVEVEVRAPATTPHAVVPFGEIRKRVPRLHGQGFDPVAVHRQGAHPQTVAPEAAALGPSAHCVSAGCRGWPLKVRSTGEGGWGPYAEPLLGA